MRRCRRTTSTNAGSRLAAQTAAMWPMNQRMRPAIQSRNPSPRAAASVPFTIATDGPEMMRTHLRDEFELLLRIGALTQAELDEANARGHAASFVGGAHAARPNTPVGR